MDSLIYIILLLGSYSIGYGLIKAGFPLIQKRKFVEKIAFGYIAGIILFTSPFLITSAFNLKDTYYPLVCLIVYFILLLCLLLKRTIFNEKDALTKAEQMELDKINAINKKYSKPVNYDELIKAAKEIKEDEAPQAIEEKTANPNRINFDQGLMVKSRKKEGQVFKEENKNIIGQVNNETKKLEKTQTEEQKNSMLSKLREYAQEINNPKKEEKSKKKTSEDEDSSSEEELMNMFKDEEM